MNEEQAARQMHSCGEYHYRQEKAQPLPFFPSLDEGSNQIITKNMDGSLAGVRYCVEPVSSQLRRQKGWRITVDEWECAANMMDMSSRRAIELRIYIPFGAGQEALIECKKSTKNGNDCVHHHTAHAYNILMAAFIIMAKIDGGQMPDTESVIENYAARECALTCC